MGGPVYRYDADLDSPVKFPEEYDGDFFAGEFGRQWIKRIEQDADGAVQSINDIPWTGTQIMDMAFGPDGALYVLDYGLSWFGGDEHSALYRIENATGGRSPIAEASSNKTSGVAPLKVKFSSAGTTDGDGDALTYAWDFGDGGRSTAADPTYTYRKNGTYVATLTAKDPTGRTGSASVHVTVGNTAPTVVLQAPADGQPFEFGDEVPFKVTVTDPEDGTIDCGKVEVKFTLGHDSHGHDITTEHGCEGTIKTAMEGGHDPNANIYGGISASYTDGGGGGQAALTGRDGAKPSRATAVRSTTTTPPASPPRARPAPTAAGPSATSTTATGSPSPRTSSTAPPSSPPVPRRPAPAGSSKCGPGRPPARSSARRQSR